MHFFFEFWAFGGLFWCFKEWNIILYTKNFKTHKNRSLWVFSNCCCATSYWMTSWCLSGSVCHSCTEPSVVLLMHPPRTPRLVDVVQSFAQWLTRSLVAQHLPFRVVQCKSALVYDTCSVKNIYNAPLYNSSACTVRHSAHLSGCYNTIWWVVPCSRNYYSAIFGWILCQILVYTLFTL